MKLFRVFLLYLVFAATPLLAQDFAHVCPGSLTVQPASGQAGCKLTVHFDIIGFKDNEPFTYSVAFATQCVPRVGGTAGNNFVVDGSGFNHAPNDTACTGRYANPPPSTEDPAGLCVPIEQVDPGWGAITIPAGLAPGVYQLQVITSNTTNYNFCTGNAVYDDYQCVPVTITSGGGCATVMPTPTPCAALTSHFYMTTTNTLVNSYSAGNCGYLTPTTLSGTPITFTSPLMTGCYTAGTWTADFWTTTIGANITVNLGVSNPGGGGFTSHGTATGTTGSGVLTGGTFDTPVNVNLGSICLNNQSVEMVLTGNAPIIYNDCADFPSGIFAPPGYACVSGATNTPTKTNTPVPPTPTFTHTNTPTFTFTRTNTSTNTVTNTNTFTNTATKTATNTFTLTNTPTLTATRTFTNTATSTLTNTTTSTFSNTSTATRTFTNTATDSMTPTASLTATPTASPTTTNTLTKTNTPTPTATRTFTNTATNTYTNSATSTFTNTSTATRTFTNTATNTATNTNTLTNTPTPTATPTSSNTATNTMTNTLTRTATPTATLTITNTATKTITNTATKTATNTFTLTNTPTLTFTRTFTNTATVTPVNTATATAMNTATSTAINTAIFTDTSTATHTFTITATHTYTNTATSTSTGTATNTATNTFTLTNTPTPTVTRTFTNTVTNTCTNTASNTPTKTPTPTVTSTPTNTPLITNTATNTPSDTPTATSTSTATRTSTPTVTNTATSTATHTATATATLSDTSSNTATRTPTSTATPTATDSMTPTASLTATPTPLITNTPSNTPSHTPTSTSTDTSTQTATHTPTATPTNSPTSTFTDTATHTFTATPSSTPTDTPTNSLTATSTATSTPTNTLIFTNTASSTPTNSFTPTNSNTLTATKTATSTLTATFTSTPTNSFTPSFTFTASNTPTNSFTFTPTKTATYSFTPTDSMTATPSLTATPSATPTWTATHSFTPTHSFTATFTFTSTYTSTPTPDVEIAKTASILVTRANDSITYTITLSVPVGLANDVRVTDLLPPYLNFASFGTVPAGGTPNWNPTTKTLTWTFPSLAAGTYSLTYQAQVASYVPQGTVLLNNAQVTYRGLVTPKATSVGVTMATAYMVHVGVYNEAGELVKEIWVQQLSQQITSFEIFQNPTITSLHGQIYIEYNGQQIATWDGTTQSGDPVTNGKYYVKVDNIDPYGAVNSVSETVMVSRSLAKVEVDVFNAAGEIVRHLYSYADDPNNLPLTDVKMSTDVIEPIQGVTPPPGSSSSVSITSPNGLSLAWDGKSDSGTIVTNGHYEIEVHYTDGKGGEETISRGIVVTGGRNSTGGVTVAPNELTGGATSATFKTDLLNAQKLNVSIYTVAGELVRTLQGPAMGTVWDARGLASGVYIAAVNVVDSNGGLAQRQMLRVLVIR